MHFLIFPRCTQLWQYMWPQLAAIGFTSIRLHLLHVTLSVSAEAFIFSSSFKYFAKGKRNFSNSSLALSLSRFIRSSNCSRKVDKINSDNCVERPGRAVYRFLQMKQWEFSKFIEQWQQYMHDKWPQGKIAAPKMCSRHIGHSNSLIFSLKSISALTTPVRTTCPLICAWDHERRARMNFYFLTRRRGDETNEKS